MYIFVFPVNIVTDSYRLAISLFCHMRINLILNSLENWKSNNNVYLIQLMLSKRLKLTDFKMCHGIISLCVWLHQKLNARFCSIFTLGVDRRFTEYIAN